MYSVRSVVYVPGRSRYETLRVSALAIWLLASGAKLHKRFKLEILED